MGGGTTTSALSPGLDHIIERPRLIKLLADSGARVILLAAPAGYGKTTLARQWRAKQSGPVVWYRTTRASGDVAALAVGLDQVLAATVPQPGRDPKRVASIASVNARPAPLARALVNIYGRLTRDVLLIVDEYEVAGTVEADELFGLLVEQLDIRFLVTSRTRPSWFEPRLTIYGEALEVGADELTMTEEEALAVLSRHPRREDLGPLLATARGWPAVIGLAAMRGEDLPSPEIPARILYDFLASEMLDSAPRVVQEGLTLLAAASVSDVATAELLLGDDTGPTLNEAHRRGLVLFEDNGVLSLHPLLRDLLLARLRTGSAKRSSWLSDRLRPLITAKRWDEALTAAEAQPEPSFVSDAMAQALPDIVRSGQLATLRRWIAVGHAAGASEGLVYYAEAEAALRDADFARAIAMAERAATLLEGDLAARAHLTAGRASHLLDHAPLSRKHFTAAGILGLTDETRAAAVWGRFIEAADDEREEALTLLQEFESMRDGSADHVIRCCDGQIRMADLNGGLARHIREAEVALPLLSPDADPLSSTSFLNNYSAVLSTLAHYDRALAAAEHQLQIAAEYGLEFARRHALVNKARAAVGLRRIAVAERALAELERKLARKSQPFLEAGLLIERGRLFITVGDLDRAHGALFFDFAEPPTLGIHGEYIALRALLLAAVGEEAEAQDCIERALSITRGASTRGHCYVAKALLAVHASHDDLCRFIDQAITAETFDSIVLGCRISTTFGKRIVEHRRYRRLLSGLLTRSNDASLARRLGLMIPRSASRAGLLSPREREIHELIALGMTNHEIAKVLYISESTAKVHVRHILEKLGVRSRVEAARVWDQPPSAERDP